MLIAAVTALALPVALTPASGTKGTGGNPFRTTLTYRRDASDNLVELAAGREIRRLLRLGLPLRCGGLHTRDVALTFDDGPGPNSRRALQILRHDHAGATFFLVGKELRQWPAIVHLETRLATLGDHTWSHTNLLALPDSAVRQELASAQEAIERESGRRVWFFRPPYGRTNTRIERIARSLGMVTVLWSIDSRDSEGAAWRAIGANVARSIRGGSIILLHENRGQTTAALKYLILPMLRARGFEPVTLAQLLAAAPPTVDQLRSGFSGCHPRPSA